MPVTSQQGKLKPHLLNVHCLLLQCDLREKRAVRLEEIEELYERQDFIGWTETSAKVWARAVYPPLH